MGESLDRKSQQIFQDHTGEERIYSPILIWQSIPSSKPHHATGAHAEHTLPQSQLRPAMTRSKNFLHKQLPGSPPGLKILFCPHWCDIRPTTRRRRPTKDLDSMTRGIENNLRPRLSFPYLNPHQHIGNSLAVDAAAR